MANTKKAQTADTGSDVAVNIGERNRKRLARWFKEQEKVPVNIPPLYKPYFGRVMTVTLQGVSVAVPCDGKTYMIPASFAEEVKVRISNQNDMFEKKHRLGDTSRNLERSPGELNLF